MVLLLILTISLAFWGLVLLISGIVKKRKKFLITGTLCIIAGCFAGLWTLSESAINKRRISKKTISLSQRIGITIDEIKHPYDPCVDNDMDGPIFHSIDNRLLRHYLYEDFAVIIDPELGLNLMTLVQVEFPEYFFSISRAAYSIRNVIINASPEHGNRWLIQLTGTSQIQSETAFDFVWGQGNLDFTCPHYFKIISKVAVSASGKIYRYDEKTPVFVEQIANTEIADLTPDRELGVNLMGLQ